MRLKEFIIFIFIFTVCYIIFFIVFDKISIIRSIKNQKKLAKSLIQINQYLSFAEFYGIDGTVSSEMIFSIFDYLRENYEKSIFTLASSYKVSNYEMVIIILYLEYLKLIPKKSISLDEDDLHNISFVDQGMIQKYTVYFQNKSDFHSISTSVGGNVFNDLAYMDKHFLMPGVRFIDSKLYYVGDCHE